LLRDIPTSIYAIKMLRLRLMSPLPPGYATVFKAESCLRQVMHAVKYTEVEPSYQTCHVDNKANFKTKTVVTHAAKCWTQCHIFPSI